MNRGDLAPRASAAGFRWFMAVVTFGSLAFATANGQSPFESAFVLGVLAAICLPIWLCLRVARRTRTKGNRVLLGTLIAASAMFLYSLYVVLFVWFSGDGACYFDYEDRFGIAPGKIDHRIENSFFPPRSTCVFENGVRFIR